MPTMAPSLSANVWNYWSDESATSIVTVSCLMPNGLLIPLEANRESSLLDIKEDLWEEAQRYPMYGTLHDKQTYIFMCINQNSEQEELVDEQKRLCEVRPFMASLKLVEKQGDKADKLLMSQIGHLIGKSLHEFDALKNPEVNDFRWKMRVMCENIAQEREKMSWRERVLYQYPMRLESSMELPPTISRKLKDNNLVVLVRFENSQNMNSFKFSVSHSITPEELLRQALMKLAHTSGHPEERVEEYALKVCGHEEYLIGNYPLSQFKYIRNAISNDVDPQLITVSVNSIVVAEDDPYVNIELEMKRSKSATSTMGSRRRQQTISSWTISEQFSFQISAIQRLNCGKVEIGIQAGLFHGGEALCESQRTHEKLCEEGEVQNWDEDLKFDIKVCDIARMARLCLVVYEVSKNSKGNKTRKYKGKDMYVNPLAWVNTTVYDFKNQLKMGSVTLYMWTFAEDLQVEDMLHPLGTVVSNPNVENATALTITFQKYHNEHPITYPTVEKILEVAEITNAQENVKEKAKLTTRASKMYSEHLHEICGYDSTNQMHEQDKELLWKIRYHCSELLPQSLPKLLSCVKWNEHKDIAQMVYLIRNWPTLPLEHALELLDYAYADQFVRKFAVKCLKSISDEDLLLYLLQLVQAVKHESYLYCDLVEFLLRRALQNQTIGHYLFWHLRAEMHVPSVSVWFGLILEAYCRGSTEHMRSLSKQMEALNKLKTLNEIIKQRKEPRERLKLVMHEYLQKSSYADALSKLLSPLDPSLRCRQLNVKQCKFMDSKMKPLWIVFENADQYGEDIYFIFKNGDDLRQDMLTIQMIKIMDKLWRDTKLDLRMNPYGCISTDFKIGLIQVVLNSDTIANIQKAKGLFTATAFKKGSLFEWLKEHNPSEASLNKAVEEFTLSCAGYCVITYVLGIADRHSDNIMVKSNGQLFHIDFGHILGHFKEKFGIKRERVPFVLTHDFVHVITKGQTQKSQEFSRFQQYCEDAFVILRSKGNFIISLFAMMLSTGIPELSSVKDLDYLRETLVLDLSEKEALKHFRSKFNEALSNSWKTSVNWLAHNLAKDNKMND